MWIHKFARTLTTSTIVLGIPKSASAGDKVKMSLFGTSRKLELGEIEVIAAAA